MGSGVKLRTAELNSHMQSQSVECIIESANAQPNQQMHNQITNHKTKRLIENTPQKGHNLQTQLMTMKLPGKFILGSIATSTSRKSALKGLQIAMITILVQNVIRVANKRLPASTIALNGKSYCLHVYGL